MRRRFLAFPLVFLFGLPIALALSSFQVPQQPFHHGITTTSSYVNLHDGVKLAVDVLLPRGVPKGTRLPTILDLTRYWRNKSYGPQVLYFVTHGYAVVLVDVRGTGASTGVWSAPFSGEEIADNRELVNWVVAQPWCNGNIGAIGTSYEGGAAQFVATVHHPAVKAVIPRFQEFDEYTDLAFPGGIFAYSPVERWQEANYQLDNSPDVKPVDDDKNRQVLRRAILDHANNLNVYQAALKIVYRDDKPATVQTLDSISVPAHRTEIEQSNAAIYGWGGWMDAATADAVIRRFSTFSNPQKGMIGPWNHGGSQNASPYRSPFAAKDPQLAECLRYFDHYLKGTQNGEGAEHELVYYTMGEEKWKSTKNWPPAGATAQDWYFGENHTLSSSAPLGDSLVDAYKVDFEATTGKTNRWQTEVGGGPVIYPDRADEDRKLLTYTSPPLTNDMEITGMPVVDLFVTSTDTDGAFFVYLEQLDENGKVNYITEGELRGIHRKLSSETPAGGVLSPVHTFKRSDSLPLVPGQVAELKFALLSTSTLIQKGHRLRVAIAGADKDTFVRIPAEGIPEWSVARNAKFPSSIRIPIVPRSSPLSSDPWQSAWADLGVTANVTSDARTGTKPPSGPSGLPTVDEILNRYAQASGGREAIEKVLSRVSKGVRVYANGTDDAFENYVEHPDKTFGIRWFPFGTVLTGGIGQDAWTKVNDDPSQPVKDSTPKKDNNPQNGLQNALHLRESYRDLKLLGTEQTGDRFVYVINGVTDDGEPAKLWFDVSTGLLLYSAQKQKVLNLSLGKVWSSEKVLVEVESYFGDYRAVDGVMVPFLVNSITASNFTTILYTSIQNNVPLAPAIFQRPR
jgi:putative CocE/NonD family hydrolase